VLDLASLGPARAEPIGMLGSAQLNRTRGIVVQAGPREVVGLACTAPKIQLDPNGYRIQVA